MLNLSGDFIVAAGHMSVIEVLAKSPMQVWSLNSQFTANSDSPNVVRNLSRPFFPLAWV